MINERNFFDQPVKSYIKVYDTVKNMLLIGEMIAQLVGYFIMIT